MTTVAELIDRALRDWLEAADDQPTRAILVDAIDEDDDSLAYDPSLLSPEEEEILAPGTLIEIGNEEIVIGAIDEDTGSLSSLIRGANGTTPAEHAAGALIFPNRTWRRRVIFDAIGDAIVNLYPDLYRIVASEEMTASNASYIEVPLDIVDDLVAVKSFLGTQSGVSSYDGYPVQLLSPFPPSSTGKAILVDVRTGASGYLIYKAKFPRPASEDDVLLDDLGVDQEWEPLVLLDVVAYLIAGRELDLATQERLSEQLEQANYAAGTPSQIRDGLLRYRELKMRRAKDALRVANPVTVTMNGIAG